MSNRDSLFAEMDKVAAEEPDASVGYLEVEFWRLQKVRLPGLDARERQELFAV